MSRGAFEAWYDKNHWSMLTTPKEDVALIWQAAQDDAFERAAKVCEAVDLHDGDRLKNSDPRLTCSDAIRALAKEPTR